MNYSWKFTYNNSEVILEGKVVTFLFDIAGNYSLTLTVTDEAGNSGEDVLWVNVSTLPDGDDDDDDNDDDDVEDDDIEDDENDDNLTDNGDKRTDEKAFFSSTTGLMIAGAMLILIILGVVIATRKKRRLDEPEATPSEKEGGITAEVPDRKRDGAIDVEEDAALKDDEMTEKEGEKGAEDESEVEVEDELEVEGKEVGDAGIDVDIAVDDEVANELSKNDLDP